MRFGLKDDLIEQILKVLSENPKVKEVIVFGSRARGDSRDTSDLDIAIKSEVRLESAELNRLKDQLNEMNTIYKIDLVDTQRIDKQHLLKNIDQEGISIFRR